MKTYKKGISLIVLVITVIVLAILATTVIISLSNTNIISQASKTVFKSDMASYKELYSFYLADKLMEDATFNSSILNVTSSDAEFTKIFGDNVKDAYKEKLQVVNGKLVYKTLDATETEIVEELGMAVIITPLSEVKIGALVEYIPTANPEGSYEGATYVKGTDGYFKEDKTNYTPGEMSWVYLGQDENGNILLTSTNITNFKMKIGGQDGWSTGPDRMDTLCNTLYGNNEYTKETRNMKIEDVNRVLEYDGPYGSYFNADFEEVTSALPMTFGEIETADGITITNRITPRLSTKAFEDYLSDNYYYTGTTYKADTTDEYKVIFNKENNSTDLSVYWLSSVACDIYLSEDLANFCVRYVRDGKIMSTEMLMSDDYEDSLSFALLPVIVLKSNIHFGETNANGELKLVEM